MPEYITETDTEPKIRAWLMPADPNDEIEDPFIPREDGWRIVIETVDESIQHEPLRSTWEPTVKEAMAHTEDYWKERPVWRDYKSGEAVDLYSDDFGS
ncbi:MAG: hypothetical protein M3Q08_08480 [Pseudomonadota bacterium]|nr:hypothetical protein [Pseudomonadota bacterium]